MPVGLYEVQVVNRESGDERWVQVSGVSREDAIEKVISLGEIVGEARLLKVIEPAQRAGTAKTIETSSLTVEERERLRSNATTATVLAWIGLIVCGPLGLASMIWGITIQRQSKGEFGTHAFVVGLISTALWAFLVLIQLRDV